MSFWQRLFHRDDKATRQRLKALCRAHAANKREEARLATLKAQTTAALRSEAAR